MSPGADNTRVGLTLGKFAPLHRGHQSLIEKALAETDRLIVMIYDCGPYEDTWDRSGEANRREFQDWTIDELVLA